MAYNDEIGVYYMSSTDESSENQWSENSESSEELKLSDDFDSFGYESESVENPLEEHLTEVESDGGAVKVEQADTSDENDLNENPVS